MADRKSDDRGLSCSQSQQSIMDLLLHLHCKRIREISGSESSLLGLENSGYPVSLTISFSVLEACLQTQSQCTLLFGKGSIAVRGGRDIVTSAIPVLVRIHTNF